jgi:hypothetical protein
MKGIILTTAIISSMLRVCSASEDDTAPPVVANGPQAVTVVGAEAELPTVTANVEAQHGGTVVLAQDHAVEVVAQPSGEVQAYVLHVEGQAPPPPQTNIIVSVPGSDRSPHDVTLVWDANVGYYRGALVDVTPVPGPMNVVVTVNGRARRGSVARYVVVEPAHIDVRGPRGHVDVRVDAPPPPHGHVEVNVRGPRPPRAHVDVRVNAPFPPPPPHGRVDIHVGGPSVRVGGPSVHVHGGGSVRVRGNSGLMVGHGRGRGHRMH